MSRRKIPGKPHKRSKAQYIALPYSMIRSPYFKALSSDAVRVMIEMHLGFHGVNNGQISFSLRQAMACLHSGSERAKRALDMLQQYEFIICHADSSFNMKSKKAREWQITFQPMPDKPPTHEWKKI